MMFFLSETMYVGGYAHKLPPRKKGGSRFSDALYDVLPVPEANDLQRPSRRIATGWRRYLQQVTPQRSTYQLPGRGVDGDEQVGVGIWLEPAVERRPRLMDCQTRTAQ